MFGKPCNSYTFLHPGIRGAGCSRKKSSRVGKKRKGGGESQHDCLQPLLLLLSTNLPPGRALVWNDCGTPKTWRFLPPTLPVAALLQGEAPLPWAVILSPQLPSVTNTWWMVQEDWHRLRTQSHSVATRQTAWSLPRLRPLLPSDIFSFDLKKYLPLIFSRILNPLLKFQPQLSLTPCRSLNFFFFFPNLNQFSEIRSWVW